MASIFRKAKIIHLEKSMC